MPPVYIVRRLSWLSKTNENLRRYWVRAGWCAGTEHVQKVTYIIILHKLHKKDTLPEKNMQRRIDR